MVITLLLSPFFILSLSFVAFVFVISAQSRNVSTTSTNGVFDLDSDDEDDNDDIIGIDDTVDEIQLLAQQREI